MVDRKTEKRLRQNEQNIHVENRIAGREFPPNSSREQKDFDRDAAPPNCLAKHSPPKPTQMDPSEPMLARVAGMDAGYPSPAIGLDQYSPTKHSFAMEWESAKASDRFHRQSEQLGFWPVKRPD